jgi:hypothetical protein
VAQLIPHYRSRPIIQAGTAFLLFYTFFIQTVDLVLFLFNISDAPQRWLGSFGITRVALGVTKALSWGKTKSLEYCLLCFPLFTYIPVDGAHDGRSSQFVLASSTPVSGLQLASDGFVSGIMPAVAALCRLASPSWQDFVIPIVILWSPCALDNCPLSRAHGTQLQCSLDGNAKPTSNLNLFYCRLVLL